MILENYRVDSFDRKILAVLQQDGGISLSALAEQVGLSSTPCWRRIQRLEADGVIARRVALLDPESLGLDLTVFVSLRTNRHDAGWLDEFTRLVTAIPEVVEVNRLAGAWDYLLRVVVPDITAYDAFYKKLITIDGLGDVTSSFSMERIKYTTALPLDLARING